jgi:hypothetical protein
MSFSYHFQRGQDCFELKLFNEAKAAFLAAIEADPHNVDVFRAIMQVEAIEEIEAGRQWYGDDRPNYHAISLFGSIPDDRAKQPYFHYGFFGQTAYNAFTTAYYLQDLLRLRRFTHLVQPSFMLVHLAALALSTPVEFLELGSTLYAAKEKLANCARVAGEHAVFHFLGVELSSWLRSISEICHPGEPLALFPSCQDVPPARQPRLSYSLGVGNYAFENTAELIGWLRQSRFIFLRERFNMGGDFQHQVIGKRFNCFDLGRLIENLRAAGYRTNILSFTEPSNPLPTGETPPIGALFLDVNLLVHNFNANERERFAAVLQRCGVARVHSNYNTNPPIELHAGLLESQPDLDAIRAAHPLPRSYSTVELRLDDNSRRFDFAVAALDAGLAAHIAMLDRIYPS